MHTRPSVTAFRNTRWAIHSDPYGREDIRSIAQLATLCARRPEKCTKGVLKVTSREFYPIERQYRLFSLMGLTAYRFRPSRGSPHQITQPGSPYQIAQSPLSYERPPVITAPVTMVTFSGGMSPKNTFSVMTSGGRQFGKDLTNVEFAKAVNTRYL